MNDPPIDLLGPKRAELGLPTDASPLLPTRALLIKGGSIAGSIVVLTAIGLFLLMRQEQSLREAVAELTPHAQRADQLTQQVASVRRQTAALQDDLESMTNRLVAIRSGSALLEQLKRVTPSSVQLERVSVGVSRIQIDGVVSPALSGVGPLEQLNALLLNLEELAGVPLEGARVQKATRRNDNVIEFDVVVDIDTSYRPSAEDLSQLGAEGLARRHRWLRSKGLPL